MSGWTKLFSTMLESSVCESPLHVRWVWVCMLAICDVRGFVSGTTNGLARRCNVTREQFEEAISLLTAPDHTSRSTEMEGRRLIKEPGGWLIVNRVKFRDYHQDIEGSRAPYMRAFRANRKTGATPVTRNTALQGVALHNPEKEKEVEVEKEVETEKKTKSKEKSCVQDTPARKSFSPPTEEQLEDFCKANDIVIDQQRFINHYESNGWRVGRNPMKDWKAAVRNWQRNDQAKSHGGLNATVQSRQTPRFPEIVSKSIADIDAAAPVLHLPRANGV